MHPLFTTTHRRRCFPATTLLCALAAVFCPAPDARAQVKLQTRITPGSSRVYHSDTSSKQILTLAGMDIETASTNFTTTRQTTGKRQPDGTVGVEHETLKMQQEIKIPSAGVTITFDSDNPDKKADLPQLESLLEMLRLVAKTKQTFVYDKKDRLTRIKGIKEIRDSLPESALTAYGSQLNEKTLIKRYTESRQRLPSKPVKVGEKWTNTLVLALEAGQTLTWTQELTYVGTTKKKTPTLHKISVKTTKVKLAQDPPPGSPTKIVSADLKVADSSGEILVDIDSGTIVSDVNKVHMKGPLTLEVNGVPLKGSVDLTMQMKATLKQ